MAGLFAGGLHRKLTELVPRFLSVPSLIRHNSKAANKSLVVQLKHDYPGLGTAGDFAAVRPGFARNFLVPRGVGRLLDFKEKKAWLASQEALGDQATKAMSADAQKRAVIANLPQVLNRLSTHTLILRGQTGPGGLIKPLTVNDLVKAIFRQYKIDLDASSLDLNAPINKLGETLVPIYVNPEFSDGNYMLKVHVVDYRTKKKDLPPSKPVRSKEDGDASVSEDDEDNYFDV
mmetsp:Transcript_27184/g.51751  ORF Transcript_27184/g.51751 Transcript_27184/m.51751 type:complete len:232 (+) Transcript_27184:156-851(+)|eukprot:CAMPEP_0114252656 /NCGR_PEP_ID=MMETSP0058-20121206/15955_1 /TAXON_ID=36894 /ORGANISM="Pyramimonas parkeae, CCMP726" /LENGTH=231 /DNA_ID=CAMNT_0001366609 /DNA_START=142 /DNA_END=837 /DNA_ORIENTATION=+